MKKASISVASVIALCGACIAFYIGAGFATMQEVMQYEASYGSKFWVVILVAAAIFLYTNLSFANNGARLHLKRGGDIYKHYCGKHIGTFFDYFSAFFCYVCFIVMCGGANSTATQQWGLPNGVGAIILTIVVVGTALFGLKGIVNALSKIGPVIIVLVLLVSVWTVVTNGGNYAAGAAAIDAGQYELNQVGGGNPLLSGASYGGFVILWFASFLSEIGAKNRVVEVDLGVILSGIFIFVAAALCCIALISCIDQTSIADIPALVLAGKISPLLSQVFAIIVFCGIYTTSVPLLWTGVGRVAEEGTNRYRMILVIAGIIGCVIACFLPYAKLVNVLYGLNGYLGFILVAFMIVHDIAIWFRREKSIDDLSAAIKQEYAEQESIATRAHSEVNYDQGLAIRHVLGDAASYKVAEFAVPMGHGENDMYIQIVAQYDGDAEAAAARILPDLQIKDIDGNTLGVFRHADFIEGQKRIAAENEVAGA